MKNLVFLFCFFSSLLYVAGLYLYMVQAYLFGAVLMVRDPIMPFEVFFIVPVTVAFLVVMCVCSARRLWRLT